MREGDARIKIAVRGLMTNSEDITSLHYGQATTAMINALFAQGVTRATVLMRHSARFFDRNIHDLLNPLTEHGRTLSRQFGEDLTKDLVLRGYASPPERCVETSELIIAAHESQGGTGHRTRPIEGLGVFYVLDQQKMWKGLAQTDGLADYVSRWFNEQVPADALMPAPLAVQMVLRVLQARIEAPPLVADKPQLDVCVTHDMTVYTVRHGVGLESAAGPDVEFLDGLVMYQQDGVWKMRSQHGGEVDLSALLG